MDDAIHASAVAAPVASGPVAWLATAEGSGVVGSLVGMVLIPVVQFVVLSLIGLSRREPQRFGAPGA